MTQPNFKIRLLVLALFVGLGAVTASYFILDDSGDMQILVQNTKRTYVGHRKCAECHSEIAESHQLSGHSSTFAFTNKTDVGLKICGTILEANDEIGKIEYICNPKGLSVSMEKLFGGRPFPLEYAFGSGKHAVTFVTLLKEANGDTVGIEHRNTWYRHSESLGPTPGQEDVTPSRDVELYGKIIQGEDIHQCVSCHVTTGNIVGTELTNLRPGVNCEKCHGPGSAHVAMMEEDEDAFEKFIERNWSAEKEIQMCGQCHRTASDIAPERLVAYPPSVTRFQPVGLQLSRCYLESEKDLRCSTCHNPHEPVEARSRQKQVETCLQCHQSTTDVHCPVSPTENCIKCHMPKVELVEGVFFHDHWIRVVNETLQTQEN